ncbi:hypothetical protein BZB76_6505 [Actinomadura pelletieri DSM 43383]|uniref:Uncharacterized protein n=1 Tax=Actinomadura pelletieri DSM 43383 TaxID=1120940 RepID=A0A495Q9S0_9ACTN|nr:hypothetical protein [Actinomadura pelletieri]RKS68248.1 hypothetical protein BZB76_6505 [Actinomadura pelletieri DSM 43383]
MSADHRAWAERLARSLRLPGVPPAAADTDAARQDLLGGSADVQGRASSTERIAAWREAIQAIAAHRPGIVRVLAYRPADVVERLTPAVLNTSKWCTLVELYEAVFELTTSGTVPGLSAHGHRVAAAHLTRTRWILLSLPFAPPPVLDAATPVPGISVPADDLRRLEDGSGTAPAAHRRLLSLAQQARDDWAAVLATIEDQPQLAARISDLETDLVHLASAPLLPSRLGPPNDGHTERDAQAVHRAVAGHIVQRQLLPRFAWWPATHATVRLLGRSARLTTAAAATVLAASTALFVLASISPSTWAHTAAAGTAAAGYALIVAATALDRAAAWPWMLRQPAGAAIGLVSLAALAPDWWRGGPGETGPAALAALGIAATGIGYLVIEAANHGVTGLRLARRPLGIGLLGLAHAFWVALVGLRFLLPVFAENPDTQPGEPAPLSVACWYADTGCQGQGLPILTMVAVATAWSFAAGVFLQIVWDDQPATAPLAHVSWRRTG